MPISHYPRFALGILIVAVGLALGSAIAAGVVQVLKWREGYHEVEQLRKTQNRTTAVLQDGRTTTENRQRAEYHVAQIRRDYNAALDQAKEDDPEIAARGVQPVPPRLLELAKERRVARERLGCATSDCDR